VSGFARAGVERSVVTAITKRSLLMCMFSKVGAKQLLALIHNKTNRKSAPVELDQNCRR